MSAYVPVRLRRQVRQRAGQRCEYCLLHEDDVLLPHEPDHIIAVKHGGETTSSNLAWTCFLCNRCKGSDIASVDPETGEIVGLFSPREDEWRNTFLVDENALISGKTPAGRATSRLLQFNHPQQIEVRQLLMNAGLYPAFTD